MVVFLGFGMPFVCNVVCFLPPAVISLTAFLDTGLSSGGSFFVYYLLMTIFEHS